MPLSDGGVTHIMFSSNDSTWAPGSTLAAVIPQNYGPSRSCVRTPQPFSGLCNQTITALTYDLIFPCSSISIHVTFQLCPVGVSTVGIFFLVCTYFTTGNKLDGYVLQEPIGYGTLEAEDVPFVIYRRKMSHGIAQLPFRTFITAVNRPLDNDSQQRTIPPCRNNGRSAITCLSPMTLPTRLTTDEV
jgi:hypothetical protein